MTDGGQGTFGFCADSLSGKLVDLEQFRGKVLLIVNTASQCVFTSQYRALEVLYRRYRQDGLEILGFPCNQFSRQEPGTAQDIQSFCELNYGVSFPMFAKIEVNGKNTHPLFIYLKQAAPGLLGTTSVKWNFTKFLVGRDGRVHRRYATWARPAGLAGDIERLLRK